MVWAAMFSIFYVISAQNIDLIVWKPKTFHEFTQASHDENTTPYSNHCSFLPSPECSQMICPYSVIDRYTACFNVSGLCFFFCQTSVTFIVFFFLSTRPHLPVLWARIGGGITEGQTQPLITEYKKNLRKKKNKLPTNTFPTERTWPQGVWLFGLKGLFTISNLICTCGFFAIT